MRIPKWAHLPPNSNRLDFCGCCREGLTREKSTFTGEKWPKNGPKFDLSNLSPPGKMAKKGYKWVYGKFLGRSFI